MNDGSIRIKTKLDTSGVKADLKDVESMVDRTAKHIKDATAGLSGASAGGMVSGAKAANAELKKAADNIEVVTNKMTASTPIGAGESVKSLNKGLEKAQAELDKVNDEIAKIQAETDKMLPFAMTDDQAAKLLEMEEMETAKLVEKQAELNEKVAEYKRRLAEAKAERERIANVSGATGELNTDNSTDKYLGTIGSLEQAQSELANIEARMEQIRANANQIASQRMVNVDDLLAANKEYQSLNRKQKALKDNMDSFKTSARVSFEDAKNCARSFEKALDRGLKKFTRIGLSMMSIRGAYSLLSRAANAYISSNEAISTSISNMWATLGEMLGPAIEWICNLLLKAIGYINAFVTALSGINFMARANEKALNKQAAATAGAAKASNQLAAFDEQNKLSDTSGGGGGGGSAGGLGEFKTPELDPEFLAKIEWLAAHFKDILWYVGAIAAGLLGWKIADALGLGLKDCLGVALALSGAVVLVKGTIESIMDGVDWQSLTEMLIGTAALAGGLAITFGSVGAAIGLIVGGIALLTAGIIDFVKTGEMCNEALIAIEAGILAIAGAIALLTGSWIPLVVGAVVGLVVAIVAKWDEVKAAFSSAGTWFRDNVLAPIGEFFSGLWEIVSGFFVNLWNAFAETELFKEISGAFVEAWETIKAAWDYVEPYFTGIWNGIKNIFSGLVKLWSGVFKSAWELIKGVWDVVVAYFKAIWQSIKQIFSVVGTVLSGPFKIAWSAIKATWDVAVKYFTLVWSGIKAVFSVVKSVLTGDFNGAWESIKNVWNRAKEFFLSIWNGIKSVFSTTKSWFGDIFKSAWNAVKNVFSTWGSFFSNLWSIIKRTFTNIGTTMANAISGAVKSGINGVISMIEGTVNTAVNLINGAIRLINKIPGVQIGSLSRLSLPRLARGGIVNNPGKGVPAVIGEAGKEAVLPLENNTEWMDILAEKIGGGTVTIPIYLDGKKIYTYIVDMGKKKAFAANGA